MFLKYIYELASEGSSIMIWTKILMLLLFLNVILNPIMFSYSISWPSLCREIWWWVYWEKKRQITDVDEQNMSSSCTITECSVSSFHYMWRWWKSKDYIISSISSLILWLSDKNKRPFYTCLISYLSFEWMQGWPSFDRYLPAFVLLC